MVKLTSMPPFLCVALFLDVKDRLNKLCGNFSIQKPHDFCLRKGKEINQFLHSIDVDAGVQESLASDHMEGEGCVWAFPAL